MQPPEERPSRMAEQMEAMRESSSYLGLGLQLALNVVFFAGMGYLLDRWLGTLPWLLIAGVILGLVGSFVYLLRVAADLSARQKKRRASKDREEK